MIKSIPKYLFLLITLFLIKLGLYGQVNQFPQVFYNGQSPSGNLLIRSSNSLSSSALTSLASKIGVDNYVTSNESNGPAYWARACLPSIVSSASPKYGYMLYGQFYAKINEVNNYATVNTASSGLTIRPCANCTSSNVTIGGSAAYFGKGSIVALTGNVNSGWYEVYLTTDCNQTTGWLSGTFLTLNTNTSNYYVTGGTVNNNSGQSIWGANVTFGGIGNTNSTEGFYQHKLPKNWSGAITANHPSYSNSNPTSISYTANNHNYSQSFVLSNAPNCSNYTLSPSSRNHTSNGGNGTFNVNNVNVGCSYTAVSNNPWITNVSTSAATVSYTVSPNTTSSILSGSISVKNGSGTTITTFSITQDAGTGCNQTIFPTTFTASPTSLVAGNTTTLTSNTCSGCTYKWTLVSNTNVNIFTNYENFPDYAPQLNIPGTYTITETISTSATCLKSITRNSYVTVNGQGTGGSVPQQTQPVTIIDIRYPKPVAADPVNLITGKQEDVFDLIKLPVIGGSLNFSVFYNGSVLDNTDSKMGRGRRHSFDYRLISQSDEAWIIRYPDLHETQFVPVYNNENPRVTSFPLTKGIFEKLIKNPSNGEFTLTFKNQTKLIFASTGELLRILDRNSNTTNLSYQNGKLAIVTGQGGRGLNLSYTNELLTNVSTLTGESVSFGYLNNNLTSITDLENKTYSYNYNGDHSLDWVKKPNGKYQLRNVYGGNGKISLQYDSNDIPTEFIYSAPNKKTTLKYQNLSTRIYEYDEYYRVIKETDEDEKVELTVYDENNIPSKHTDKNGVPTTFETDTDGNVTDIYLPLNKQIHKKYTLKNDLLYQTEIAGDTIKNVYDLNGNLIKTIFEDNTTNEFTVNSLGQITAVKDAKNNIINSLVYNSYGDLIKKINPFGEENFGIDNFGRTISITDPIGKIDSVFYNKIGKKIKHRNANGKAEFWVYDQNHNEIQYIDFKGNVFNKLYDNNDQLIEENGPLGFKNRYKRNFRGFISTSYNSVNDSVSSIYNNRGHLLSNNLNNLPASRDTLDNEGNVLTTTDPLGKTITNTLDSLYRNTKINFHGIYNNRTEYNSKSQPFKLFDGLSNFKTLNYNKRNNITQLYDELNNPINITYDANQKTTQIVDAEGNINLNGYDILSRPLTTTDASNNITVNEYNTDGTVKKINKPDNTNLNFTYTNTKEISNITYSSGQSYYFDYDDNGNNTTITGPNGQETFTYNALDQKISYKDVYNNTIGFTKNALGINTKIIYPGNFEINIKYNAFNKPDSISLWNGSQIVNSFDNASHLTSKLLPNGIKQTFGRDAIYRVNQYTEIKNIGNLADTLYNFWCNRNLVSDIDSFFISGKAVLIPKINIQNKGYTYSPNDAVLSDSVTNYFSNLNGAITDRKKLNNQILEHFDFIQNDLLSSYTNQGNTYYFKWNGLEKLIGINKNGNDVRLVQDCTESVSKLLMTQDNAGSATGYYIHGYNGPVAYIDDLGKYFFYHFDIQGNTVFLTDELGAITDKYSYDIHGTLTEHIGNSKQMLCTYGQHGAIMITDSLVCIQSRMLSTTTGRFLSKDRANFDFKDPFTLNKYVYANNNPLAYYDITGWGVERSTYERLFFDKFGKQVISTNYGGNSYQSQNNEGGDNIGNGLSLFDIIAGVNNDYIYNHNTYTTTKGVVKDIYTSNGNIRSARAAEFAKASKFVKFLGVAGSVLATAYSTSKVVNQIKTGQNVDKWDASDAGVGLIGLGAGLITAPAAAVIGGGALIYSLSRLSYDLSYQYFMTH